MKKLLDLESSFSNTDTSWTKKFLLISNETFKMVIYVWRTFLQSQSFFIVSNQNQMIFILGRTGWREGKLLKFKKSSKTFTQDTKAKSNYIYFLLHFVICFNSTLTNLLAPRGNVGFQCICRAQLVMQLCYKPLGSIKVLLMYF